MSKDTRKSNNNIKLILITGLAALIYSVITFIIFEFDGGSSFWISYCFAMLSIMLAGGVAAYGVSTARKLLDWIFSFPVIRWCVIYVIFEICLSTVFMIFSCSWKIVFLSQFIIPILFLVLTVPCFVQKSHIESVTAETVKKVVPVREMNAKLLALLPRIEDSDVKKAVEKAADAIRYSDPASDDSAAELEENMRSYIEQLDALIREANYKDAAAAVNELNNLIEERKQLVMAAKLKQSR